MNVDDYYKSGYAGGAAVSSDEERVRCVTTWAQATSGTILDVGCSHGRIGMRLKSPHRRVLGVDLNIVQLREARGRLDGTTSFDICRPWPIRPGSFAGIHLGAVVEHIFDYRTLFAEAALALSPGGSLFISTPNMASLRHRIEVLLGRMPAWYKNFEHIRPWTVAWLDEAVAPFGLSRVKLAGAHVETTFLHTILSSVWPTASSIIVVEYRGS